MFGPIVTDFPSVIQQSTATIGDVSKQEISRQAAGRRLFARIQCHRRLMAAWCLIYGAWDSLARIALQPAEPTTGSS